MQKTSGKSIFTGAFCAFSCALWRRAIRISPDWTRRIWAIDTPKVSACTIAWRNERSSTTSVRSSIASNACRREAPTRVSASTRRNSSLSAPGTATTVRLSACSNPSPASTEMVSRSITSGSCSRIFSWRSATLRFSHASGPSSRKTLIKRNSITAPKRDTGSSTARARTSGISRIDATRAAMKRSKSLLWGRPASTSRRRALLAYPGGVSSTTFRRTRPARGRRTRSPKEGPVRLSTEAEPTAVTVVEALSSVALTAARSAVRSEATATSRATAMPAAMQPTTSSSTVSHLDPDRLGQPPDPQELQHESSHQRHLPPQRVEQGADVGAVDQVHETADGERQDAEDPGAQPALRRQGPNLSSKPLALDHGVGDRVEDLRQVAAHLALYPDRHDRPLEIPAADTGRCRVHRVLDGRAEPGCHHRLSQLPPHGILHLVRHGVEALQEGETCPESSRQQLQHVGQLGFEGRRPAVDEELQSPQRHDHGQDEADQQADRPCQDETDDPQQDENPEEDYQRFADAHWDAGAYQSLGEVAAEPSPLGQLIERLRQALQRGTEGGAGRGLLGWGRVCLLQLVGAQSLLEVVAGPAGQGDQRVAEEPHCGEDEGGHSQGADVGPQRAEPAGHVVPGLVPAAGEGCDLGGHVSAPPDRCPHEPLRLEEVLPELDSPVGETLGELWAQACGLEQPAPSPLLVDTHAVVEEEQVLEDDHVAFHPLHLGHVGDPPGSVAQAAQVDYDVERGGHLLPDGAHGELESRHQGHRLQPGQGVPGAVGVHGSQRTLVAGVHRLEHVQRLTGADLTDDDPVRAHPQGVPHEVPDGHLPSPLRVGRTGLEAEDVLLVELQLLGVLDGDDPLVLRDERRQDVEQRGLPSAGAPRDQDDESAEHAGFDELPRRGGEGAEADQVLDAERILGELADGEERSADAQRRVHGVDPGSVGKTGVDHRRALVDAPSHGRHDPLDDSPQVSLVDERSGRQGQLPVAFDVDLPRAVDHHLAHSRVAQVRLDRAVAEDVVGQLLDELHLLR